MNAPLGTVAADKPHDWSAYCAGLEHTLKDKLFFLDRVPAEVTVMADFGCAGGSALAASRHRFGHLIGYDHDPDAIEHAKMVVAGFPIEVTTSYPMLAARLDRHHRMGNKSVLLLSSVIHEVISQGVNWGTFWQAVQDLGCTYVAIRDMALEDRHHWHRKWEIQHYLKRRYPETSWAREDAEDYFPVPVETMLNTMTIGSGYKLRHFDHHSIPFLRRDLYARFGFDMPEPTHVKILLERTR